MSVRAEFIPYLIVMAVVTYLIRMIPLALIRKKIKNKFILSFLYYVPYAVLTALTIPAIFYATKHIVSAFAGFVCAFILAFKNKSLVTVAASACVAVLICECIIKYVI